jgi:DNA-binding transcriptional LysR family regulator
MEIADLEDPLGTKIFKRNNKKVIITQLGQTALEKSKQIKLQMDDFTMLGQKSEHCLCLFHRTMCK